MRVRSVMPELTPLDDGRPLERGEQQAVHPKPQESMTGALVSLSDRWNSELRSTPKVSAPHAATTRWARASVER